MIFTNGESSVDNSTHNKLKLTLMGDLEYGKYSL